MANAYPVVQSGWLDSLTHLFSIREANEDGVAHLKTKAFRLFRQFLALKIAIPFAFADGIQWPLSIRTIAVFLVILAAGSSRFYHLGLWITLGLSFYELWRSWPFTINHGGLEFGIVFLMCLFPDDESKPSKISCDDLIKILMLSVWFFSGIHKLFDGYYWNAEFFALEALSNETALGHHLNQILSLFGSFLRPISQIPFQFAQWQIGILLVLSWLTIIVEILLPISLLIPKFRPLGIVGLFIFQCFITYFSGETDFAFTAFAILFLFVPRLARYSYPSLACLLLVVQPWI